MDTLDRVVEAFRCLPGVGPKSAQRMVFHLLQHQRQRGLELAFSLQEAMQNIKNCIICNDYTTSNLCKICDDTDRDDTKLCVVESPTDVLAIEQTTIFTGKYYVLMGKISPLDGIGPQEIGLPNLASHVKNAKIREVIIALSPSIEGQTTLHYIHEMLRDTPVKISQIAQGIPSGSNLSFLDSNTISCALRNRELLNIK